MPFEETREQQAIYSYLRSIIYLFLILEIILHLPVPSDIPGVNFITELLWKMPLFQTVLGCKSMQLVLVGIVCIGTKARKDLEFNMKRQVIYPIVAGVVCLVLCLVFSSLSANDAGLGVTPVGGCYLLTSVMSIVLIHFGLDSLSKHFSSKLGKDRFNYENESFPQSRKKDANDSSVNIPMFFYYKRKMTKGWINITNPFRGTIVLGTPGSGKSFGIIDPFIRQHAAKGFAMMVYDYKYPALARNLYYQFHKARRNGVLPPKCGFRVVNFSDVEYSNRINPIQEKYIPDLASASETAATLLAALNKGGGEKKGGSEAFFTNSAENFLAAIIYFFVTFHPIGYRNGKKLQQWARINGKNYRIVYSGWTGRDAIDEKGKVRYDFIDNRDQNRAVDEDNRFVELTNIKYQSKQGEFVNVERTWWTDMRGKECTPDTFSGEFSDMPHVLAFLGRTYDEVFGILMKHDKIMSLMAPFASAYKNKANDQLEGMVGTLRVNAARLVSPEAYWVFSGDDFDLKISDRDNPSYLVIANDPEKEQVIGSLNALILNRLVTRVNSKGNIPVSIIVDELPTLYFHKIDRLIGTARSNKVAVTLGFQELPQLESDYGKVGMHKIITTCGNIFTGAARNKETLEWLSNDVFGKVKQISESVTIDASRVSKQLSERMDALLPAAKIADMATGWLAGQAARDFSKTSSDAFSSVSLDEDEDFKTTKYFCKTNFNMAEIAAEEKAYVDLPKIYQFKDDDEKEVVLNRNFKRINDDIEKLIGQLMPEAAVNRS